MSTYTVKVSGVSPSTTDEKLHDFFTFCGKINRIDHAEKSNAVIHFEKSSAAKTALMLNGGTLDGATLSVTSDTAHQDEENHDKVEDPLDQSDKPRAGIAAEYLAKGYILSDHILQRAIEIDQKQGISKRFLNYISSLDSSMGARALGPEQTISGKVQSTVNAAAEQAKSVDREKGISSMASGYYSKAMSSPIGQKVLAFYTTTTKQVQDIHEEARRIAEDHKPAASTTNESSETKGSEAIPNPTITQAPPPVL